MNKDENLTVIINYLKNSKLSQYIVNVLLYGSRATGNMRPSSDYDVFVVLAEDARQNCETKREILKIKADGYAGMILEENDVDFNVTLGNEWENSHMAYYRAIKREGVPIWT